MDHQPRMELEKLLISLLTEADVRRIVRLLPGGEEMHAELPGTGVSLTALVHQAISVLERHGRLDGAFFDVLDAERPARRDEIQALAARMLEITSVTRRVPVVRAPASTRVPVKVILPNTRAAGDPLAPLALGLEDALKRKQKLEAAGLSTSAVLAEIRTLKREHRRGGQLRPGDALGDRYLLAEQIGRGGFATVWRARDSANGEDVAIKVLHPELAGDVIRRQRFFRGARIMAELAHPIVVRLREREAEDDGFFYFVMDFISGGNLQDAVLAGRVRGEQVVPIILSIGEALAQAHVRGHVHRDVKPVNILLTESGAPRLADFDLVTAQDTTGGTRTGALGTFIYAAPEMMDRPQDADARVDVYGLGMTVAFALHGDRLPRRALTAREQFIKELGCRPRLQAVLKRATAEDPDERHPDAAAFCEALREASARQPVRAFELGAGGLDSLVTPAPGAERGPRRLTNGAPRPTETTGLDLEDIPAVLASSRRMRGAALETARALQGVWTNPDQGSVYCISLVEDRLIVPYCWGGNAFLTAVWYDCLIEGGTLYCHFHWLSDRFRGHVSMGIESRDYLVGHWWNQSCELDCKFPAGPRDSDNAVQAVSLERLPGHKMPDWAAAYFRRGVRRFTS